MRTPMIFREHQPTINRHRRFQHPIRQHATQHMADRQQGVGQHAARRKNAPLHRQQEFSLPDRFAAGNENRNEERTQASASSLLPLRAKFLAGMIDIQVRSAQKWRSIEIATRVVNPLSCQMMRNPTRSS